MRCDIGGEPWECFCNCYISSTHLVGFNLFLRATLMGIITSSFSFLLGAGFGVYIAQNYDVPNMKNLANTLLYKAKEMEETYRKNKRKDDD